MWGRLQGEKGLVEVGHLPLTFPFIVGFLRTEGKGRGYYIAWKDLER